MADVVGNKDNAVYGRSENQSFFKKNLVLIMLFVVVIAVGFFTYKINHKSDYIKIGDSTITSQEISDYTNYVLNNDKKLGASVNDMTAKKKAIDVLVMNAALKKEAKDRNIVVSKIDIEKTSNDNGVSPNFDNNPYIITQQINEAYKQKLEDKLIKTRDILIANVNLDSPYFASATDSQVDARLKEAKSKIDKLNNLFLKKSTPEQIVNDADYRFFGSNKNTDDPSVLGMFFKQPVSYVRLLNGYKASNKAWNDLNSGSFMRYKVGEWKNTNQEIIKLKKEGDLTGIFASKTGALMIIRLEKTNNGSFDSWNSFNDYYVNKYYKNKIFTKKNSEKSAAVNTSIINPLKDSLSSLLFTKVNAATVPGGCGSHDFKIKIYSYDDSTSAIIHSSTTTIHKGARAVDCGSGKAANYTTNTTISENCYTPEPTWSVTELADSTKWKPVPGGPYKRSQAPYSVLETQGIKITTVNSDGKISNGFPNWNYDANNGASAEVYFHYTPIDWKLTPKSTPAEQNAYPGDTKNFSHTVGYTGNKPTYKYRVLYSYVNASTGSGSGVWITAVNWKNGAGNSTENTSFKVPASYSKGDRYCQRIEVTLATGPGSGNKDSSPPACLTILTNNPFKFTPTPSVLLDDDESPGSAVYTPTVKNESSTNASTTITTKLYIVGGATLATLATKNETQSIAAGAIFRGNPTTYTQALSSLNTGNKICSTVTVAPYTDTISNFTSAPPACATVVNKPFFKVINGSVMAGNCTRTGILAGWFKNTVTPYKGASTELASIADGQITGFGSRQIATNISPTELTFASQLLNITTDKDSPKLGGNFGAVPCQPDASQAAGATDPTSSFNLNAVGDNLYRNGNTTITTSSITNSTHKTVFIDGDVFIAGNITYSGSSSWSDSTNIPSLILRVKGNIYISSAVTQLDGIYIAKPRVGNASGGSIYTCALASTTASSDYALCKNQLVVNGIFIANKINLLRTFGSLRDVAPSCQQGSPSENTCAGEVFKLSPEIYLNGTTMDSSISTGSYKYDAITSLPPIL